MLNTKKLLLKTHLQREESKNQEEISATTSKNGMNNIFLQKPLILKGQNSLSILQIEKHKSQKIDLSLEEMEIEIERQEEQERIQLKESLLQRAKGMKKN